MSEALKKYINILIEYNPSNDVTREDYRKNKRKNELKSPELYAKIK
tara:strand:- start:1232 stop:1369 length:138 start_codon:yes stop_codon:yes gene_type:complete